MFGSCINVHNSMFGSCINVNNSVLIIVCTGGNWMVNQRAVEVPKLWRNEWNHLLKISHFLRVDRVAIRIQGRYVYIAFGGATFLASFEDTNILPWLMCTER